MNAVQKFGLWRIERAWARGSTRWMVWAAGLLLCLAGLAMAGVPYDRARRERAGVDEELHRADAMPHATAPEANPTKPDFVQSLGPLPSTVAVVQELQRACSSAGILLSSVQAQSRAPSMEQLGRLELSITLRGPYAGTKQVLKQAVERFPGLTVQRLRMRRGQSPADVETNATLSLWSTPVASPELGASTAGR